MNKETKKDVLRRWGLPEKVQPNNLRYDHPLEKGIYWWLFSNFVRMRDVLTWGRCISCGRGITLDSCDAGHFIPAHGCGRDLLFDERNVNAECKRCNGFDEMHLLGYAEGLDLRYGHGTSSALRDRYIAYRDGDVLKDWPRKVYETMLMDIGPKVAQLRHKMGLSPLRD